MTEKEFEGFLTQCHKEVNDKQKQLIAECALNQYTSYTFDQKSKSITFKKEDGQTLTFDITCIGSWHQKEEGFVWAWANDSFSEEIRKESEVLKELAQVTGYDIFEKEGFKCEEIVARDLAYMSIHQLKALGIYRIVVGESYVFLALKNIK